MFKLASLLTVAATAARLRLHSAGEAGSVNAELLNYEKECNAWISIDDQTADRTEVSTEVLKSNPCILGRDKVAEYAAEQEALCAQSKDEYCLRKATRRAERAEQAFTMKLRVRSTDCKKYYGDLLKSRVDCAGRFVYAPDCKVWKLEQTKCGMVNLTKGLRYKLNL